MEFVSLAKFFFELLKFPYPWLSPSLKESRVPFIGKGEDG